ncbi:MAG: hypothetical protein NTZ31_03235 [Actinobacteria bacterium]|jgi:hypothetical protein|nr:hypothetical protein [Actinomycetota bacterium]
MAITTLIPVINVPRAKRALVGLVPGLGNINTQEKLNTRKFQLLLGIVVTIDLLVIATLNLLMTQDAFELQRLKHERNIALDQRDATLREVNAQGSPDKLAVSAHKLGMIPAQDIKYIDLAVKP